MKKVIVAALLLIIIFFAFVYSSQNFLSPETQVVTHTTDSDEEIIEFEGKLTKFDDKCKVDGICKAVVNEYTIITNPGEMEVPVLGQSNVWTEDVGKKVKVRAKRVNNRNLTLVGDSSLYVKLVE